MAAHQSLDGIADLLGGIEQMLVIEMGIARGRLMVGVTEEPPGLWERTREEQMVPEEDSKHREIWRISAPSGRASEFAGPQKSPKSLDNLLV